MYLVICLLRLSGRVNPRPQYWHFAKSRPLPRAEWYTLQWRRISPFSPKRYSHVSIGHRTGFQWVFMCLLDDGQPDDHLPMPLTIHLHQASLAVKRGLWLTACCWTMKDPIWSRYDVINRTCVCLCEPEMLRCYCWWCCSVSAYNLSIAMPHRRYFPSLAT